MDLTHMLLFHPPKGGPSCRRCAEPIDRSDPFGLSERVCGPCRSELGIQPGRRGRRSG